MDEYPSYIYTDRDMKRAEEEKITPMQAKRLNDFDDAQARKIRRHFAAHLRRRL